MAYKWFEHCSDSVKGKSNLLLKAELVTELQEYTLMPYSVDFKREKGTCILYWPLAEKPSEAAQAAIAEIFTRVHYAWKLSRIELNTATPGPGGFRMIFKDTTP
jgi:5-methylcytosine-specific restriction endonuclease McrBC regulatory subunit McrC